MVLIFLYSKLTQLKQTLSPLNASCPLPLSLLTPLPFPFLQGQDTSWSRRLFTGFLVVFLQFVTTNHHSIILFVRELTKIARSSSFTCTYIIIKARKV